MGLRLLRGWGPLVCRRCGPTQHPLDFILGAQRLSGPALPVRPAVFEVLFRRRSPHVDCWLHENHPTNRKSPSLSLSLSRTFFRCR